MANAWYKFGLQGIADGSIDLSGGTIRLALVTSGYTVNLTTHEFLSSVTADIVARSNPLSTKTFTLGAFAADNSTWTAVSGSAAAFVVIYQDNGSDATNRLIGYIDTASGLPITPNGSDITMDWSGSIALL